MVREYQLFEKYKRVIVNEIVEEFGSEYEEYIRNLFNNFKIIFETPPWEEYKYCKENLVDRGRYYYEYIKLEYLKKKIYNKVIKEQLDNWINHFIDLNKNDSYEKIYRLFYSNKQLVDYFSSKDEARLVDSNVTESIKKLIKEKRERFISIINKLGFNIINLDSKMVDLFIIYRDKYFDRIFIKYLLEEDNNYVARISKIINDNNSEIINDLINKEHPTCFKYVKKDGGEYRFVYLPINRLRDIGNKTIDVILIHEMIHYIQKISDKEVILDETLVQQKASIIVGKLHKKGIFIFDREDDGKIYGECIYEVLYPFVNDINLLVPGDVMNETIINNDYRYMEEYFGDSVCEYMIILDKLYNDFVATRSFSENNLQEYERCIKKMITYYNNRKPKVRKRIIDK